MSQHAQRLPVSIRVDCPVTNFSTPCPPPAALRLFQPPRGSVGSRRRYGCLRDESFPQGGRHRYEPSTFLRDRCYSHTRHPGPANLPREYQSSNQYQPRCLCVQRFRGQSIRLGSSASEALCVHFSYSWV